jgi:uncharacterized protein
MFITALIMGFAGSLHCVGMCSPLAMTVSSLRSNAMTTRILYNLGRVSTYGMLGILVGSIGWMLPLSRFQQSFSIMLGILLLITAFGGTGYINIPFLTKLLGKLNLAIKIRFGSLLTRKTYLSTFLLGSLNGLLPCGLTFISLTYCLSLESPVASFIYMVVFGLGTLPAMLGATAIFQFIVKNFGVSFRKLTLVMLVISGTILIARAFLPHSHETSHREHPVDIVICR